MLPPGRRVPRTLPSLRPVFFLSDTATAEIYTLSLHDALPIPVPTRGWRRGVAPIPIRGRGRRLARRSEEHTSELQSRRDLVCRLLLEKKKKKKISTFLIKKKKKKNNK